MQVYKASKYESKLWSTEDSEKRNVYENKIKKYSISYQHGGTSETYIIFTITEALKLLDYFIKNQSEVLNKLKYYFPGLVMVQGIKEVKTLHPGKTSLDSMSCRVPGFMLSDISFSNLKNLSMLYSYRPLTSDLQAAEKDFKEYYDKKQNEIKAIEAEINAAKQKLDTEKARRDKELELVGICHELPDYKKRQEKFNENMKHFYVSKLFSKDVINTSEINGYTIDECSKKLEQIKKQLEATQPNEYGNVKGEIDNFTCAIIVDSNKKLLAVYDFKNNKPVYTAV